MGPSLARILSATARVANYENEPLRLLARELPCQNCGADDGTVVCGHSNLSVHGKGKHLKSHDNFHAALCYRCHGWLDNAGGNGPDPTGIYQSTRQDKNEMFRRASDKTMLEYWRRGLIAVA